tara:strand:+ start:563 stop:997 length:435 start_codon:yes stop_codon:yes gene_type:complete
VQDKHGRAGLADIFQRDESAKAGPHGVHLILPAEDGGGGEELGIGGRQEALVGIERDDLVALHIRDQQAPAHALGLRRMEDRIEVALQRRDAGGDEEECDEQDGPESGLHGIPSPARLARCAQPSAANRGDRRKTEGAGGQAAM